MVGAVFFRDILDDLLSTLVAEIGILTRSGFKKRSNSRSYRSGSTPVMPMQYAARLPTPEPLPGPTGMPMLFA